MGEGVPPDPGLPESHEQAEGLGRNALCESQRLARHAALPFMAALAGQL